MMPSPEHLREMARASLDDVTTWEAAIHEAGHVIVEWDINGSCPDRAYLAEGLDHAGRTMTRSFVDVGIVSNDPAISAYIEAKRRRYASVLAAGELARAMALGCEVDTFDAVASILDWEGDLTTDQQQLAELVAGMAAGEAEAWLGEAHEVAVKSLRRSWAGVSAVAAALVERGDLDGEELCDLLDAALARLRTG